MIKVKFKTGQEQYYTSLEELVSVLSDPEAAEEFEGAHFSGNDLGTKIDTESIDDLVNLEQKYLKRQQIREEARERCGDTESLLGTTADGVQLLLFAFSQLTVALNKATSLAEVRGAAAPFNDLATSFLGKVESGEVKLPFQAKGLENVVADIETRSTAVTEVLTST